MKCKYNGGGNLGPHRTPQVIQIAGKYKYIDFNVSDFRSGRRSPIGSFSGASVTTHGSLLRHVILRGVSSQLQSAADRVQAGKPTSMAVSSLIAIGTSKGIVLVFGKYILPS